MCYVGLDAGTTGIKAYAFNEHGSILASAYREYPLLTPREGWCELDPKRIWDDAKAVLSDVAGQLRSPIRSIAVSSQGQAVVPLDHAGEPLYPFLSTVDTRTVLQNEWWKQNVDEEEIFRRTGLAFSPIYTINKIMWHRDNQPDLYKKVWKFLCVGDYLTYRLTGETVIDYSLAGRGMMLNARDRRWDEKILALAGIDPSKLSTPTPAATPIGRILPELSAKLGISSDATVVVGAHDQMCGTIGCGVIHPGQTMDAIGTVEVLIAILGEFPADHQLMRLHYPCSPHAVGDGYAVMSINQNGGALLKWYKNTFCGAETASALLQGLDPYTYLIEQSSDRVADLYVLPHVNGAETPIQDPLSAGAFVRLRTNHTKADVTRAVLDSMAFDMRQNIDALESASVPVQEIRAIGGGTKTPKLLQIKADATKRPIVTMQVSEAASLGAAMLGAVGVGDFSDCRSAIARMVKSSRIYEPNPSVADEYDTAYEDYKMLYPALAPLNHRVAARREKTV